MIERGRAVRGVTARTPPEMTAFRTEFANCPQPHPFRSNRLFMLKIISCRVFKIDPQMADIRNATATAAKSLLPASGIYLFISS
jgi:hypothetical protein